jgi:hypothetical protein
MLGNSHVRFGVGAGVKSPGPHHASRGIGAFSETGLMVQDHRGMMRGQRQHR